MHLQQRILVTGAPDFWVRTFANACCQKGRKSSAWTISLLERASISSISSTTNASSLFDMTSRSRSIWKSIKSIISPVPHRQFTINTTPSRRRRPACMARSTCLVWLGKTGEGKDSSSLDLGNLRRSQRTSPTRRLLGQRQSDRAAVLLFLISRAPRESEREVARFAASFAPAGHQNAVYFIPTVAPFCRQVASWLISYNAQPP